MKHVDLLSTINRFWLHVDRKEGACWNWTGGTNNQGYGRFEIFFRDQRQRVFAHRLSYVMANGGDIHDLVVMHSCDNPRCVNPDHLSVGSQRDNVLDCIGKGRADLSGLEIGRSLPSGGGNRGKTHCKRGHEFTEANTYRDGKGRRCRECARAYNAERQLRRKARAVA